MPIFSPATGSWFEALLASPDTPGASQQMAKWPSGRDMETVTVTMRQMHAHRLSISPDLSPRSLTEIEGECGGHRKLRGSATARRRPFTNRGRRG